MEKTTTTMVSYYSKSYLLNRLKLAKLPHTYHTLIKYEKKGIIQRPGTVLTGSVDRFYTMDEIEEIIKQIKRYKK
jgi:hypothetical protein